jgi:hypothetical protein
MATWVKTAKYAVSLYASCLLRLGSLTKLIQLRYRTLPNMLWLLNGG